MVRITDKPQQAWDHYHKNLNKYISEHPGEYVILDYYRGKVQESFSDRPTADSGVLCKRIPNHGSEKTFLTSPIFIDKCPNDNKTKLWIGSGIFGSSSPAGMQYYQWARCPECGCDIRMKPKPEQLEKLLAATNKQNYA